MLLIPESAQEADLAWRRRAALRLLLTGVELRVLTCAADPAQLRAAALRSTSGGNASADDPSPDRPA